MPRRFGERRMTFDSMNAVGDLAHNGCRVTRPGAYFENVVAWPDLGGLDHQRDDIRLGNRLAFADRQRPILICEFLEAGLHKRFTGTRRIAWMTYASLMPRPAI